MTAIGVIVALIVAVVGVAAGYFIGYNNRFVALFCIALHHDALA